MSRVLRTRAVPGRAIRSTGNSRAPVRRNRLTPVRLPLGAVCAAGFAVVIDSVNNSVNSDRWRASPFLLWLDCGFDYLDPLLRRFAHHGDLLNFFQYVKAAHYFAEYCVFAIEVRRWPKHYEEGSVS